MAAILSSQGSEFVEIGRKRQIRTCPLISIIMEEIELFLTGTQTIVHTTILTADINVRIRLMSQSFCQVENTMEQEAHASAEV